MSKSRQKEDKRGFMELISLKTELESDALIGEVRVELRGRNSMFVGGCRRIITYSPCLIVLAVKGDKISIKGERLVCTSYHSGTVSIDGQISSVSFGEGEKE